MHFDPHKPFTGPDGRRYACAADYLIDKPLQSTLFDMLSDAHSCAWAAKLLDAAKRQSYFARIDDLVDKVT